MRIPVVVLLLGLALVPARARAATIIFDACTDASYCNQVWMTTSLQPDRTVALQLISPNYWIDADDIWGVNLALAPGWAVGIGSRAVLNAAFSQSDVTIGPYGTFAWAKDGPFLDFDSVILTMTFRKEGGFSSDLEPFVPNELGFIAAAQVRARDDGGDPAFVAARLPSVVNPVPIPEPGTILLFASGLGLMTRRLRDRRQ
jgi:hypothetical protein